MSATTFDLTCFSAEMVYEMDDASFFSFMKAYYADAEKNKKNKSVKHLCDACPFVGEKANQLCGMRMPKQWKALVDADKKKCDELFGKSREAEKNGDLEAAAAFKNEAKKLLPFCNPNNIAYNQVQAIRCYTYKPDKKYEVFAKKTTYDEVLEVRREIKSYIKRYSHTKVCIVNGSITDSMRKLKDCFNCVAANQWDIGGGHSNGKMAQEEAIFYALYTKPVYDALIPIYGGKPIGENWVGFNGIGLGSCVGAYGVPVVFDDTNDYEVFPVEKQREINLLFNASTDLTLLSKEELDKYAKEIKDYDKFNLFMILDFAATEGVHNVNISAPGCGVFKHDPKWVSKCLKELLEGPFNGVFENVVITLSGNPVKDANILAFKETFGITDFATVDEDGNIVGQTVELEALKEAKAYEPVMTPEIEAFLKCLNEAYDKKLKAKLGM
jgi:hypothetical protein